MNVQELIKQAGGLGTIAKELGLSQKDAASGAEALLPAVMGGFKKRAGSDGESGLGSLLGKLGGAGLADDVLSNQPTHVDMGNNVLGAIFGTKDVSRAVAADASKKSGLSADTLKKMLPMLAMLVGGFMAKKTGSGATTAKKSSGGILGSLGGLLGGVLGGSGSRGGASQAGGGLLSMLDADGDGNPLDDIMGMLGKKGR